MNHNSHIPILINQFNEGSEEGFDHFFRQWYGPGCYFAQRFITAKDDCKDIVADCFVRLWQHREQLATEQSLKSYLYTSIYHACLRHRANQDRREEHESAAMYLTDTNSPDYLEAYTATETLRQVYTALEGLPTECRKVFTKLYIEGKSVQETATELEIAVSTVKNQKARGIRLLREVQGIRQGGKEVEDRS